MTARARGLPLALLALAACGTGGGHTLGVDLLTDFTPGTDFAQIVVTVGAATPTTIAAGAVHGDLSHGARLLDRPGLSGTVTVRVRLTDAHDGTIATRTTDVVLTADYVVRVVITRSCLGVACPRAGDPPDATECSGGLCVAPACTGASCTAQCTVDTDCHGAVACTVAHCDTGTCLFTPSDARCTGGMRCDATLGCVAPPPPMVRCGDGTCTAPTETCSTCSADCGACTCVPDCHGRTCGDDGCHHACGTCAPSATCDATGHCVNTSCTPSCAGRTCGPDPVCGASCGSCFGPAVCDGTGHCGPPACTPSCGGRTCGPDPVCGTSCGGCSGSEMCDGTGHCVPPACTPDCSGRTCGPDPVCGTSCGGSCGSTFVCNPSGQCVCPMGQTDCGGFCASCCPTRCTTMTMCACGATGVEINSYCYDGCGGFNVTMNPAFTRCDVDALVAGTDDCGGACMTSCISNTGCSACVDGGGATCGPGDRFLPMDCGPPSNGHCLCT